MGRLLIPSGGAGGSSGDCTATKSDVLKGVTAITSDSDDEPVFGTLELTGNITAADIRKGKTGYSTDPKNKISGQMKEISGKTVTPSTTQVVAVEANTFVTGDVSIPAFELPAANIVKKNALYKLYGKSVRGEFSGIVIDPTDLYNRGQNVLNWGGSYVELNSGEITFEQHRISGSSSNSISASKTFDFNGFTKIVIECNLEFWWSGGATSKILALLYAQGTSGSIANVAISSGTIKSITIPFSRNAVWAPRIGFMCDESTAEYQMQGAIYRIYAA